MTSAVCDNCRAPLTGPYCAQCGQHAHASARPLRALLHETWHLLTHVDARLLSTLGILLRRPGLLTLEYFAGRRARHVPPFQLYFVISLALFALVSLGMHLHPPTAQAPVQEVQPPPVSLSMDLGECDTWKVGPPWLTDALRDACRRHAADRGQSLERHVIGSISKMMFIFLPLMAFIMMLLYLRPRHFYVEHLIFFLHVHAALYVAILVGLLIEIPGRYVPWIGVVSEWLKYLLWAYAIWYIYRSMRRFYGQGRLRTGVKFVLIGTTYLVLLCVTLLSTLILNALLT